MRYRLSIYFHCLVLIKHQNIVRRMGHHDGMAIYYDNHDYLQRVRHQIVGGHGSVYNYTTAKLVRQGDRIPEGGLHQDMMNPEFTFKFTNVLNPLPISRGLWKMLRLVWFSLQSKIYILRLSRKSTKGRKTGVHRCRILNLSK